MIEKIRFIFFIPAYSKILGILRTERNKYYVLDFNVPKYKKYRIQLINRLSRLYTLFGRNDLRSISFPRYIDIINLIRDFLIYMYNDTRKGFKNKKYTEQVIPEYLIISVSRNDQNLVLVLDLDELPRELDDIPVAWYHKSPINEFPETYCLVIGHRDIPRIANIVENEESEEPAPIKEHIVCPLVRILLEHSGSLENIRQRRKMGIRDYVLKKIVNICKNVYRCAGVQEKYKRGFMHGSDKLDFAIESHPALIYNVELSKTEKELKKPRDKGSLSSIIPIEINKHSNIYLTLKGFKLQFRRRPVAYVGTFDNEYVFTFKSSIIDTTVLKIEVDSRWLLSHFLYYLKEDPYLRYVTSLKLLLTKMSRGFIPDPSMAMNYDPSLSISRLGRTIQKYINNPEELKEDIIKYNNKLINLSLKDTDIIKFLNTIAIHTFAHLLYLAIIEGLNSSTDELGLIIKKRTSETSIFGKDYPFNDLFRSNPYRYYIYIYEKAEGGLGYFNKDIYELIHKNILSSFNRFRRIFEKLDEAVIDYRQKIYESYYSEARNFMVKLGSVELNDLLIKLEKLSNILQQIDPEKKDRTLLPIWIIRYGLYLDFLEANKRRFAESTIWLILSGLFDLYWDVSPNDLVLKYECIYPDIIQYFTLSRRYAINIMDDLIESIKYSSPLASPLTIQAEKAFTEIDIIGKKHVFYTPWIDNVGKSLILRILSQDQTKEVFLVLRNEKEADKVKELGTNKIHIINLQKISDAPLHNKLYVNDKGRIIVTSSNLLVTSLKRNIEGYVVFRDPLLSKAIIGFTNLLLNTQKVK